MEHESDKTLDVSVIIAAYNAAGFIERALASAVNQTVPPCEVIVVDDASSDDTIATVQRFAARFPSVRVVALTTNGGPSRARNAGMRAAQGAWVAILDADDAFKPDRLQHLLQVAEAADADFIADNQILYDIDAAVEGRIGFPADWASKALTLRDVFENDLPGRSPLGYALLKPVVKTSFIRDHAIFYDENERNGEDFNFMTDLLFAGAKAVLSSHPGYIYSTRIGSVSRKTSNATRSIARFDRLVELSDVLERKYDHRIDPDLRAAIRARRRYLDLIHQSNVARMIRTSHRPLAYVLFVVARPQLLTLLGSRIVKRLLNSKAG